MRTILLWGCLLLISIHFSFGQAKFSVVCKSETNTTEVILSDQVGPTQRLLKGNFPNRAVAEQWMKENHPDGSCQSAPPPGPLQGSQPINSSTNSAVDQSSKRVRKGAITYNRTLTLKAGLTHFLNADLYYPSIEGGQQWGYQLGGELTFGNRAKWGGGFYYTKLIGGLEETDLGAGSDGTLEALKARFLIRSPIRIGKDAWVLINFHGNYYFNVSASNEEDLQNLSPIVENNFGGLGFGLSVDIRHVIIGADFEFIYSAFDSDIDKSLNVLDLFVGVGI